ncbi:MAG: flagellar motor switch protein FliN [Peptostreptococcaceae bacterium]|nr:flagellar motor switch protein FliN [Peptostreptococcaceae bacterium]
MNHEILSSMEIDAIGEIVNISLGSSATAVSNMLNARVDITVPRVRVESYEQFEFKNLEPAIAVTIDYVQGISGNNIMILKKEDIRVILEMLMQTEIPEEGFELDEISISAVCEVMNQMMGASSTALSELMGKMINISPPTTFEVKDVESFKGNHFDQAEHFVVIEFDLSIEGKLKSEFMNVMPMDLVKEMVATFMKDMNALGDESHSIITPEEEVPVSETNAVMSQEAIEAMLKANEAPAEDQAVENASEQESSNAVMSQEAIEAMLKANEAPAEDQALKNTSGQSTAVMSQEAIEAMLKANETPKSEVPQPIQQSQPAPVSNHQMEPRVFEVKDSKTVNPNLTGVAKQENVDMLMDVPLVVSVEIGRTKKPIREILEITQGSLIVLDKLAGDQVELYANNRCIAKGDVVVVHDNFGIRVTEVLGKS